ncbi:AAA family ATPase [Paraburkholderia nemoris]|uniref:DNA replication and repair protein RecF n=1 Tax=Paraburkholderia nemoris TaxID=2793076 RepID=A0ABN7L0F8_9BURK|nr:MULTISPECIES: AAA family ATPase [Paraburkholderia]MBK3810120.1 AAA family ATPase [Paraburkholderia aspalathi]CAE6724257.1 DNA replication and repair protein RecF [Paraburkholderia nemoris]CAE6748838.1 DNA replication and repair protein RecF [Paraburkholderia nemoris]
MEELQLARQKVVELLGEVKDVEEAVVRAERLHEGKCYAIAYVDLADNVVGRAGELHDFQERILGDDFFGAPGDLRWNKYLYIVAGPKSLNHDGFEKAKASIESDKEYARKRVVSEEELAALLGSAQHFTPSTAGKDFNVVGEWEKRLAAADLDELLDRPTRKDVVERIGTRSAKRVPVADKTLTLNPADTPLARKWLESISIDRFRPIHDGKSYTFGQVTLIVGANGTGKTSLLEAVEYFYCGHNRRQGNAVTPKISGSLAGNIVPLSASVESGRIRARCFSWYNRDERFAKSILGAFTRYNFLDTDAAFRLSTELEPSEIPDDLSRLLVGADASTIWDYLSKILPEVETAHERAIMRVDESRQKLDIAQKELTDLQGRPSNGKALTEAFRTALDGLRWKAPRATTPLATAEEAEGLQEALGHLQAVLGAGSAVVSLDAISARGRELDLALTKARPLEAERARYAQEMKRLAEQAIASERASQTLDRWLTYVNSGFSVAHARVTKVKTAADTALGRLGMYANSDIPEVPEEYAAVSLESAVRGAKLDVQSAITQVTNLERLCANFEKGASARAQAAHQLRAAAQASFDAGHPKDDCPICRAKYSPQELSALVDQITDTLEQSSELTGVIAQLAEARKNLEYLQGWVRSLQFLQRIAEAINLAPDATCAAIPARLVELKAELAKADSELAAANQDWEQLANSGLTTNEHDLLRSAISPILLSPELELNVAAITEARVKHLDDATATRKFEAQNLELFNSLSKQLAEISTAATVEGWTTRAQENAGMQSLVIMRGEIESVQNRTGALQGLMEIDDGMPLAELNMGIVGAARIHSEAMQAVKIESMASGSISTLVELVEQLNGQLTRASEQAKNYQAAKETLELLRTECSLERATQESLSGISSQINEIFSRIHAPNEYEYVGRGEVLVQTSASHEKRTLEQVSTGQRAAFALSVFLAMNRSATTAPPVILIDDPIAHIDDLNALSFLDYLRDLAVNSNRQIFFATADTRIASLFARKFGFLGESFQTIQLVRESAAGPIVN